MRARNGWIKRSMNTCNFPSDHVAAICLHSAPTEPTERNRPDSSVPSLKAFRIIFESWLVNDNDKSAGINIGVPSRKKLCSCCAYVADATGRNILHLILIRSLWSLNCTDMPVLTAAVHEKTESFAFHSPILPSGVSIL